MKHWLTTLAATGVCCAAIAVAAIAPQPQHRLPDRAELQKRRAELRKNNASKAQAPSVPIMGGTNGDKPLYGMILNDAAVSSMGAFYEFSGPLEIHADGCHVKLAPSRTIQASSGCYYDGNFVAIYRNWDKNLITYSFHDADTWELTSKGTANYTFTSPSVYPTDITYDPTTKRLYGWFMKKTDQGFSSGTQFGYLDLTKDFENWTAPAQIIKDCEMQMLGIACSADGVIFAVGSDMNLYTVNKVNGDLTTIGAIDLPYLPDDFLNEYAGAEIDWETGDIYFEYVCYNEDTEYSEPRIMKINPKTAECSTIADFGDAGTMDYDYFPVLFFKQKATQSTSTPAKVENLTVTADGVLNAANISFDMPSVDTDGKDLSGTVDWKVAVGSGIVASGQAAPGAKVETRAEVTESGLTTFVVYAQSGDNEGSPIASTVFVGNDTPMIPGSPIAATDGTDVQIIWDQAVGVHQDQGGNIADVTYKVVRLPDNKVIAEAETGLSATDRIESFYKSRYSYEVTPMSGSLVGEPRTSRPFYAGQIFELPHENDFSDELLFRQYPAIDANNDGNTWWVGKLSNRTCAVYSSNENKADDYLCVGPFDMKAGSKYNFTMDANGHSNPEKISVWAGTDRTDGSTYTNEVVPSTFLRPSMGESHLTGSFVPEADGRYYFAVKAESDANMQNIYVFNVKVTETSGACPAAPADLTATPCDEGMRLSCTLPALTLGGDKAALTGVRIMRDNQIIADISAGVTDGAGFTWTDTGDVSDGEHTYSVAAVNASGVGDECLCKAWWGADRPGKPTNMRVYQDINDPLILHVTWEAPKVGIHGGSIDPAGIDWVIGWLSLGPIGSGAKRVGPECRLDLTLTPEQIAKQDIVAFSVYGENAVGSSSYDGKLTRSGYVGPALQLPFRESWTGFTQKGLWSGEALKDDEELFESYWDMWDGHESDITSQDDDCMYALTTTVEEGGYRVRSPRLAISGETDPTLVFYLLYTSDAKDFAVEIAVDDQPMTTLRDFEIKSSEYGRWQRVEIPLGDYKNSKYFQLGFKGHAVSPATAFCCIDNLSVLDLKAKDLTAIDIAGPRKAEFNEPVEITATFRNSGSSAVGDGDYKILLLKNGKTVAEKDGMAVACDANAKVTFNDSPTPADPEDTEYKIEIAFDGDENVTDNIGAALPVRIVRSIFPTVTDLSGDTKKGVVLNWSEPAENEILPDYTVEGFDTYAAFTTSALGEWKTCDVDGAPTVVLSTALGVLNYPNVGTPMAWQVIDPLQANILLSSWTPRSGANMLVSFQACNAQNNREKASEDWLISPELYGGPQTVSFYACSGMGGEYVPEIMDIMYSTTGTDIDDFTVLEENVEVGYNSADWTEFSFNLPEGARYFAIVHKSYNKVALMIDDVKYIKAGSERRPLALLGYNIYRDGVKINAEPVGENIYDDMDVETGKEYVYHVSVVWDKGESQLSNEFKATAGSGVGKISAATIRICVVQGAIRVAGAAGMPVEVYSTSGMRVASVASAPGTVDFSVGAGVYIVRAPGKSVKVKVD